MVVNYQPGRIRSFVVIDHFYGTASDMTSACQTGTSTGTSPAHRRLVLPVISIEARIQH